MPAKRPRCEGERRFRWWWQLCADRGECDASDGKEFRRVYREWVKAGRPARIKVFIRVHANTSAEG